MKHIFLYVLSWADESSEQLLFFIVTLTRPLPFCLFFFLMFMSPSLTRSHESYRLLRSSVEWQRDSQEGKTDRCFPGRILWSVAEIHVLHFKQSTRQRNPTYEEILSTFFFFFFLLKWRQSEEEHPLQHFWFQRSCSAFGNVHSEMKFRFVQHPSCIF